MYSQFMMHGQKNIKIKSVLLGLNSVPRFALTIIWLTC